MLVPSCCQGTALVGGADVRTQLAAACRKIGVCPQFDVQWPELTVRARSVAVWNAIWNGGAFDVQWPELTARHETAM